ncbi:hypothetical protein M2271_006336 [Streptomyces sp. LBL]|nr:hypothetical protein [Streptomyces sp. LBL]
MPVAALRHAARETVSGLPREFWWLWTSTLVNRLGAFVATFVTPPPAEAGGFSLRRVGVATDQPGP